MTLTPIHWFNSKRGGESLLVLAGANGMPWHPRMRALVDCYVAALPTLRPRLRGPFGARLAALRSGLEITRRSGQRLPWLPISPRWFALQGVELEFVQVFKWMREVIEAQPLIASVPLNPGLDLLLRLEADMGSAFSAAIVRKEIPWAAMELIARTEGHPVSGFLESIADCLHWVPEVESRLLPREDGTPTDPLQFREALVSELRKPAEGLSDETVHRILEVGTELIRKGSYDLVAPTLVPLLVDWVARFQGKIPPPTSTRLSLFGSKESVEVPRLSVVARTVTLPLPSGPRAREGASVRISDSGAEASPDAPLRIMDGGVEVGRIDTPNGSATFVFRVRDRRWHPRTEEDPEGTGVWSVQ